MDITFVLCPNIIGLLGLGILLIFTKFNFYLDKKKLKLFIISALINMAIIVFEVADYWLGSSPFEGAYLLRRVTSAVGFALTPVLPYFLVLISEQKKLSPYYALPALANIIMCFASIFTGHLFWIDEYNSYFRGILFYAMIAISAFYLLLLIGLSLRKLNNLRSGEAAFLLGIAAVILTGNLLEIIFSFHFILWNSCAVLLITYYLFLHIQYFKFDPLTGVFNRNMFMHEVSLLERKSGVGVLSFDLDGLKKINDLEGHEAGDRYIIKTTKVIGNTFDRAGHLFRIGGDEFVVLLSDTTAEKIEALIAEFQKNCLQENVRVSCGYSYTKQTSDISQMLRDADKEMYNNKRDRIRNR